MTEAILTTEEVTISTEDDIVLVRWKARTLADRLGFDPFATAAIVTAASELARNVWRHASRRSGRTTFSTLSRDGRGGLRMMFEDDGPGIVDVERALAGGNSTVKTLGLGLAGSRRLADEFTLESVVGKGTKVTFTKWKRR
ncbi:MAG: anti-sigma regulatory factor [Deltaproteobacteria bacterium]|nr:anti-sigma regulatory factor [Deltaproteobacteria bacterium]